MVAAWQKSSRKLTLSYGVQMDFWQLYLACGLVAGFLAGLLGVGGGLVVVPALTYIFIARGFPHAHLAHLAVGTSLASIVFTSLSSIRAHHRLGGVDWPVFRRLAPGIVFGTLSGAFLAAGFSTSLLQGFLAIFMCAVALQMIFDFRPHSGIDIPGKMVFFGAAGAIGFLSSMVGIGGGTLTVPFLLHCRLTMRRAIGTSAAIGFPIALSGALGFALSGSSAENLPEHSLGFIHLPALACVATASVLAAPLGASLSHRLPVRLLKRIFAVLLLFIAIRMLA